MTKHITAKQPSQIIHTVSCPYCGTKLDKMPVRKCMCRECRKNIYPWKELQTNKIILLKETELQSYNNKKEEYNFVRKWKTRLLESGMSRTKYEELGKKLDMPSERDVIWCGFNQLIMEYSVISDFRHLKDLYFSLALFDNEEGNNPFDNLRSSHKMHLLYLKQTGNKVRIMCSGSGCETCEKQKDKIYPIDYALTHSILPNSKCTQYLQNGQYPFCRCSYI